MSLELGEGTNLDRRDVLNLLNLLNKVVDGENLIDSVEKDLNLLHTVGNGDEVVGLPLQIGMRKEEEKWVRKGKGKDKGKGRVRVRVRVGRG